MRIHTEEESLGGFVSLMVFLKCWRLVILVLQSVFMTCSGSLNKNKSDNKLHESLNKQDGRIYTGFRIRLQVQLPQSQEDNRGNLEIGILKQMHV